MPDEQALAQQADHEAAVRRRAQAEQALRSELLTASGQCVVDALVAPWLSRQEPWLLDDGPLPPADVLLAALRLLHEDPSVVTVEAFVAAEPVARRADIPPPPPEDERLRFVRERPGHSAGWRVPEGLDVAAHAVAAERLRALDDVARGIGSPMPVEAVLGNPRWWPGRQAEPKALSSLLYGMFRREEARGIDPTWLQASYDLEDLLHDAAGLPPAAPEAWVLAATDHALRAVR